MFRTARLFRTARPSCDVNSFSLSLRLKATSRSVASFRRVPGLGEQTPSRDTSVAHPLQTRHTSPRRRIPSGSEDARATPTKDYVVWCDGRKHDFYEYFLQQRTTLKPPMPSPWIVSLDPNPEQLPIELTQDPLRVFDGTEADLKLAKLCLQTFVARAHRDYDNGAQARELYKSTKVGVRLNTPETYESSR